MKQQTAVDFLLNEFQKVHKDFGGLDLEWLKRFDKANKMFEQQIIDARNDGFNISGEGWNGEYGVRNFDEEVNSEQYYNETFEKNI